MSFTRTLTIAAVAFAAGAVAQDSVDGDGPIDSDGPIDFDGPIDMDGPRVDADEAGPDGDETVYTDGSVDGKVYDDAAAYMNAFNEDGSCKNFNEGALTCLLDYGSDVSGCYVSEDGGEVGSVAWANNWLAQAGIEATVDNIQAPKYAKHAGKYCVSFVPARDDDSGDVVCPETEPVICPAE